MKLLRSLSSWSTVAILASCPGVPELQLKYNFAKMSSYIRILKTSKNITLIKQIFKKIQKLEVVPSYNFESINKLENTFSPLFF